MASNEDAPRASSFADPGFIGLPAALADEMKAKLDNLFAQVEDIQKHYGIPAIRRPAADISGSPSTSGSTGGSKREADVSNEASRGVVEKKQKLSEKEDQQASPMEQEEAVEVDGRIPEDGEPSASQESVPKEENGEGAEQRPKHQPETNPLLTRGGWDWSRTEVLLERCSQAGIKGIEQMQKDGQSSYGLTALLANQASVQWVRRMDYMNPKTPLPLRGPFVGKIPHYRKLADNPLKLSAMPHGCDLKLTPTEKPKAEEKPYRLGFVPPAYQDTRALDVWEARSVDLRQFEALSLQFERIAALQALQIKELEATLTKYRDAGSPEVKAAMAGVRDRVIHMRNLQDLALNRSELFAYSTYKASKCIYLEAAGVPPDQWGNLISRKWNSDKLFDGREAVVGQKMEQKPAMARAIVGDSSRSTGPQQFSFPMSVPYQAGPSRPPSLFSDVAFGAPSGSNSSFMMASGSLPGPSRGGFQPGSKAANTRGKPPIPKRPGTNAAGAQHNKLGPKARRRNNNKKNPNQKVMPKAGPTVPSTASSYQHASVTSHGQMATMDSSYNTGLRSTDQYSSSSILEGASALRTSIRQIAGNSLQSPLGGAASSSSSSQQPGSAGPGGGGEDTVDIMNRIENLLTQVVSSSRQFMGPS